MKMIKLKLVPLTFGKYKGRTPEDVALVDPGYIVWAAENVEFFNIGKKFLKKCKDSAGRERRVMGWTSNDEDYEYDPMDWDFELTQGGPFNM